MVSGFWYNQDGLTLQYGTQKAVPEMGGDYLMYGEYREVEQYIPLVTTQWGTAPANQVPPPPTSFTGNTTTIAAGIQSLTTLMPLQVTAPQTASGSALTLSNPQLFIERVELLTLQTIAPTTNTMTVGLVLTNPGTPNSTFVQATPNAGAQLIGATTPLTLGAAQAVVGSLTQFYEATVPGTTFTTAGVPVTTTGNGGAWIGNVPLVTNAITPLPQSAWISTIVSGAFTAGLVKLRVKYFIYGNINF